ncbi:hypothetical protein F4861DRAFT_277539 [Xylaria intraflava]|nr:hypothetical protein F4861DRAFT_277539 [Xylaria intraflava]
MEHRSTNNGNREARPGHPPRNPAELSQFSMTVNGPAQSSSLSSTAVDTYPINNRQQDGSAISNTVQLHREYPAHPGQAVGSQQSFSRLIEFSGRWYHVTYQPVPTPVPVSGGAGCVRNVVRYALPGQPCLEPGQGLGSPSLSLLQPRRVNSGTRQPPALQNMPFRPAPGREHAAPTRQHANTHPQLPPHNTPWGLRRDRPAAIERSIPAQRPMPLPVTRDTPTRAQRTVGELGRHPPRTERHATPEDSRAGSNPCTQVKPGSRGQPDPTPGPMARIERYRCEFEAARSFEDDDEFLPPGHS